MDFDTWILTIFLNDAFNFQKKKGKKSLANDPLTFQQQIFVDLCYC